MANTRYCTNNRAIGSTIKNGTGGGAPALDQTSPYTMAQALTSDLYTPWQTATTPAASPSYFDIDLGGNVSIEAAALLGYRPAVAGVSSVLSVEILSSTSANGYPPTAASVWTSRATFSTVSPAFRHIGTTWVSNSARYWRFAFTHLGTLWSVGKLFLGALTDLGAIHSPGGIYSPFENRLETPQPGGAIVVNEVGDPGADITLPWRTVDSTMRSRMTTLAASAPFVLVDADGNFFEVFVANGRAMTTRQYTSVFDAEVTLKVMP
jgi:hypothetical protein